MASANDSSQPGVRFSAVNQEIAPDNASLDAMHQTNSESSIKERLSPEAEAEIRNLSQSLQQSQSRLQSRRMCGVSYEPVSLPVSRVPSGSGTQTPSLAHSSGTSPKMSPAANDMQSPPLTPAESESRDSQAQRPSIASQSGTAGSDRPKGAYEVPGVTPSQPKQTPRFNVGPTGDSLPASREGTPPDTPSSTQPGTPYIRPFTPAGDREDPYARSRRPPQSKNLDTIENRFIFGGRSDHRKSHDHRGSTSSAHSPRGSTGDLKAEGKRQSIFGGQKAAEASQDGSSAKDKHHGHGSMSELKRFFKLGGHKHKEKRAHSPAKGRHGSGTATPNAAAPSPSSVPFADDHGLQTKYGKFGKVLGAGAGGSVRLLKRSSDGVTFAVKQFRARHTYETEKEYSKKVTAEFCVGSTLHHGNIIETMDLVQEKGNWFVVMEYAPFDLFAIVMTGKMSREEIVCCTLQILNGLTYIHSMGLAHRDMKLDNVVVNEHGIMKIIDFGSAAVFRYPFENDLVLASGIVGSDPYLAPEVYDLQKYDPQPADVWSLAIIFCCMMLRRFPWKAPRVSDNSYKLFIAPANDGPPSLRESLQPPEQRRSSAPSETNSRVPSTTSEGGKSGRHHQHHQRGDASGDRSAPVTHVAGERDRQGSTPEGAEFNGQSQPPEVIKGPWRLLRLLPRESRHIIGRMLEVDPKKRATLDEILDDKFITNGYVCRQEEGGHVVHAGSHEHTLEPGSGTSPPTSKKQ